MGIMQTNSIDYPWTVLFKYFMRRRGKVPVTIFEAGTVIHYEGIPCELIQDVVFYSETYKPKV